MGDWGSGFRETLVGDWGSGCSGIHLGGVTRLII